MHQWADALLAFLLGFDFDFGFADVGFLPLEAAGLADPAGLARRGAFFFGGAPPANSL